MKSSRYRWSKSISDFRSRDFKVIDNFLNGNCIKLSETCSHLDDNKNEVPGDNGSKEEENGNYYPTLDPSVWMRSCEHEVIEPIHGKVTGTVPSWLHGTLLRNGPGSLKVGKYTFDHLFDSSALLHRFAIANGDVTYQRRFIQTEVYKRNQAAQRIVVTEFGTKAVPDPCKTIFQKISAVFKPADGLSDNTMISVYPFGDEYYTFTESPVIHRIDPKTLETTGRVNLSEYVNIVNHTSHPHVMGDGTVYNVGMSVSPKGPSYNVVCFQPDIDMEEKCDKEKKKSMFDQATIVASVTARWVLNPSYMHTFGITDNYFIIIEQPLSISLIGSLVSRVRQDAMISALKWHDDENTLIHVISRKTGKVEKTFVAETFFYLHIINQYETIDGGYIVLDICCYRDAKMLDCMYLATMRSIHNNSDYAKFFRGRPLRFVLPMKKEESDVSFNENLIDVKTIYHGSKITDTVNEASGLGDSNRIENENTDNREQTNPLCKKAAAYKLPSGEIFVTPELLCDLGCETPRFNLERCLGKPYRYFYAIGSDVDVERPGSLLKVDTLRKVKKMWNEEGAYPSEPIFVPHPDGKEEDDGVILSAVVWTNKTESVVSLLILDASSFKEIARITFDTPGPVPKCLHGWFSMN